MNRPPNHHETTTTTTTNNSNNNRKTRELPNLTECHSCGFRIDTCTNGKTSNNKTMQTLDSEWRIVLLCKKCFSLVQSSRICSYCFKDSSSSSSSTTCFRCTQCNHSIHKNCFSKHKSVAPWSYSCFPAQEFSVCVDCWVPKPLARKRGGAVVSGSRVLDANSVAEEKAEVAVRAREIALRKAAVARKAVELANNALGLVVVANKDGDKRRRRRRRGKECDDDAELAIRLHRAINSSPRMISRRNLCSLNSNCLDVPKNDGEVLCASRVTSVVSETTSSTNVDCLKRGGGKVYMRKRKCGGGGGGNEISSVKWQMKEGEESCSNKLLLNSSVDDNSMNSECNGERCDGKFDRYLLKYRKRKSGSKGIIPNSESKFVCEGLLGECQASAAGLVLNCSNETRTLSNAAFRPCALSLQASASCDQS